MLATLAVEAATPSISTGGFHSLALHRDGTVRSWGDDASGQLGLGRSLVSSTPLPVAGLTDVIAVAAGVDHAVALKRDGTVWAWGNNEYGKLGDGTSTSRSLPVQVQGIGNVVEISAGGSHTVARTSDGAVWTWGYNGVGQAGDPELEQRLAPARVGGMPPAAQVSAGLSHTLVRTTDGSVWAFGRNDDGQLGDGMLTDPYRGRATPARLTALSDIVQVSAGGYHSVARRADGSVFAWGTNVGGQVGDGTVSANRPAPVQVIGLGGVVEISAGALYTLARRTDGSVWGWGGGGYGQFGDDKYDDHPTPARIQALAGVSQLAAGFLHSVAVKEDGGLWVWGANANGQLGDGTTVVGQRIPFQLAGMTGLQAARVGAYFTIALKRDGRVYTWGDDSRGQLGNGVFTFRSTPSAIAGLVNVKAISGGYLFSLALTEDGRVLGWGDNLGNQFGDNSVGRASPVPIPGLSGVTAVSAGVYHSMALLANGAVHAFGSNYRGRLGTGAEENTSPPGVVPGLTSVQKVSAGGGHTLALKGDGTVWSWGENGRGQLGDGSTSDRYQPVRIASLSDVVEVSAGADFSLARKADGSVWGWGANYTGQLGDRSEVDRSLPVRVQGLPARITSIVAARDFSLAIADGNVWAWGVNYSGGLGCLECEGRAAPVQIPGLARIVALAARQSYVLALRDDGSILAWGEGRLGQLGDGTLVERSVPVVVLREGGAGSVAANDWFLDLDPTVASVIPAEKVPVFLLAAKATGADIVADIRFRTQDVGTTQSLFVFALAPQTLVKGTSDIELAMKAKDSSGKDTHIPCKLAQLSRSGEMVAVTSQNLSAYLTGVLQAQGQSVAILNGIPAANASGATFFVGYGATSGTMINAGVNRSVVTVPGAVTCQPAAPKTGWWWNPLEDGRGFSIERRGNNMFFAAFLYDVSGRSTWHVATGPVSLEGAFFSGDLYAARGGQTLGGVWTRSPTVSSIGSITLAFNAADQGTMVWPGGTVPIQRFNIIANGATTGPAAGMPESGWWWNPNEDGRGFFMEWQGNTLDIAGYMYDDAGNPVWYLTVGEQAANGQSFSGNWWSYGNGQTLTGAWKPNMRLSTTVAPLSITFSGPDTALMTLPNGRSTALTRFRF